MGKTKLPRAPSATVEVTQEHIETAIKASSGRCMVSDAIREAVEGAVRIESDLRTIRFSLPELGIRCTYLTPAFAAARLVEYDAGASVAPFKFHLRGGLVTSMRRRIRQPDGSTSANAMEPVIPELTRARIVKMGTATRALGGPTPPRLFTALDNRRTYGMRKLEGFFQKHKREPTGG